MEDERFEIIDWNGLDLDSVEWATRNHDRCEVIMQWIQRLIVDNTASGVIPIAPPILSRVFQELSQGIVNMNQARAISDVPFPFPYAQMTTVLLLVNTFVSPVILSLGGLTTGWAVFCSFINALVLWGINYIAIELEMPFGDDLNDLQIGELLPDINRSLMNLIEPQTQCVPEYVWEDSHRTIKTRLWGGTLDEVLESQRLSGWGGALAGKAHMMGHAPSLDKKTSIEAKGSSSDAMSVRRSIAPAKRDVGMAKKIEVPSVPKSEGSSKADRSSKSEEKQSTARVDADRLPKLDDLEHLLADKLAGLDQRLARLNQCLDSVVSDPYEYGSWSPSLETPARGSVVSRQTAADTGGQGCLGTVPSSSENRTHRAPRRGRSKKPIARVEL